jgi:hypothetical protein
LLELRTPLKNQDIAPLKQEDVHDSKPLTECILAVMLLRKAGRCCREKAEAE